MSSQLVSVSGATPEPVSTPGNTQSFTLDSGATISNTTSRTIYGWAADATPQTVVSVRHFRLVPGASYTLPAPTGVWAVGLDTSARLEWALGWALFENTITTSFAFYGAWKFGGWLGGRV